MTDSDAIRQRFANDRQVRENVRGALYGFVPYGSRVAVYGSPDASQYFYLLAHYLASYGRHVPEAIAISKRMHEPAFFRKMPEIDNVLIVYKTDSDGAFPLSRALDVTERIALKNDIPADRVGVIVLGDMLAGDQYQIMPLPEARQRYPYSRRRKAEPVSA